ncbi:MAG: hypothetical protein ACYC27_13815 [Armatimonadota bacterium]
MAAINLSEEDIMRLKVIDMDRDEQDALAFIRERILPQLKKQEGFKIIGHLDGGKGSAL